MDKEVQKFLEAEETAVKLVETLKLLYNEATSYQTATKELDKVRQRLLNLIESSERIVDGSHQIIKILKEIGGPEILNRILELENKLTSDFVILKEIGQTEIPNRFKELENKFTVEFVKQAEGINKLKTMIIVTLASSITAVAIGVIALLR
jgi:predicted alternative tryptophan synthase beta-subunit